MSYFKFYHFRRGSMCHQFLLFIIYLSSFRDVVALQMSFESTHTASVPELASPPSTGIFYPIEISPAVIPQYPLPNESLPPMYPTFPATYEPVLSGKCPVNFSALSDILSKTASDCAQPMAMLVGNAICCPQFSSLVHIFQGFYSISSDKLVVPNAVANDCFSDIMSILISKGANATIPSICTIKSANLTGGSCPVNDVTTFEKMVNSSSLLEACTTVDTLKECCRPICQPAIAEAALKISGGESSMIENKDAGQGSNRVDILSDCKGVVYSYISRKLPSVAANIAFRRLSACKVNKGIQRQMLITNKQAIICATMFGSMLRKGGVMTNIYELCDVDLKDFSIQAYGQQVAGCLLRSFPADVIFDNTTGYSFTCDLNDNIIAPWPSSSSVSSLSLCAPEMSLPALPTSQTMKNPGCRGVGLEMMVPIFSLFLFSAILC
ncbi:hypothetical protein EUGRSUZ_A00037 [Eucalyptus grandis]|uniref:Uncharacterized protein n=2 Tax=Eucalyptus grandis TaxID=71139 RepID=A0A059DA78_EUCGR|nr:hypothetical protein EUGRSUZ_A00037 [Eucalyptus grandis]